VRLGRTYALHHHVHRNGEINEFHAFVKFCRDDGDRGEIYIRGERTSMATVPRRVKARQPKQDILSVCHGVPTRLKSAA
jgi:hypothetical protein